MWKPLRSREVIARADGRGRTTGTSAGGSRCIRETLVHKASCFLDSRLAARRGFPVRPVADQLLVRTDEMARGHRVGRTLRGNVGAMALYLPALSGMRLLKEPVGLVVVVLTVVHSPATRR
jgi:hypothetical protein